jgi:hypothetical protein
MDGWGISNVIADCEEMVNFVSYNDVFGNASQCASECLGGIPEQVVRHFHKCRYPATSTGSSTQLRSDG